MGVMGFMMGAMFDPPDEEDLARTPPVNNALECYRLLIWVMPTCVALVTAVGGSVLLRWLPVVTRDGLPVVLWAVVNLAATIALGIFRERLKEPGRDGVAPRLDPVAVVMFVVGQFLLVPLLTTFVFIPLVLTGVLK